MNSKIWRLDYSDNSPNVGQVMLDDRTIEKIGLAELRAVMLVAELANFRSAADRLGISPSALGSRVRSLETVVGVRLFNRTTRSVALTSAGEEFMARVAGPLAQISEAVEAACGHGSHPAGLLRINTSVTAAHEILAPIIQVFMARHPQVQIELSTEARLVDIVLEGCDAGVRLRESVPQDMIAIALPAGLDFCAVASPDYLRQWGVPATPSDLERHRCVRARGASGRIYRWEFARGGEAFDLEVPGVLTLDEQSLILKAATDGFGVAYLSRAFSAEAVAAGKLSYVLEDWTPGPLALALYYPRNRNTSAALRALIDVIRETGP
jgi:DNA-binding transcriptional LysR family regulator